MVFNDFPFSISALAVCIVAFNLLYRSDELVFTSKETNFLSRTTAFFLQHAFSVRRSLITISFRFKISLSIPSKRDIIDFSDKECGPKRHYSQERYLGKCNRKGVVSHVYPGAFFCIINHLKYT